MTITLPEQFTQRDVQIGNLFIPELTFRPTEFSTEVGNGVICRYCSVENPKVARQLDVAIITLDPNRATPRQRVMCPNSFTLEIPLMGEGVLLLSKPLEGATLVPAHLRRAICAKEGDVIELSSTPDSVLVVAEVCMPPFQQGRFLDVTKIP